jgi:hypothetical protein
MLRRPMRIERQTLITSCRPRVSGDERAALEDLHRVGGQTRIDTLADQGVMHGVVGAADFDVMILMHASADLPVRVFIAPRR